MSPRPAPDLDVRRDQVVRAARDLAESEGWAAITMRRLSAELGGLATLEAGGRLPASRKQARLDLSHRMLTLP